MKNTTKFEVGDMVVANKISNKIPAEFNDSIFKSLPKDCYFAQHSMLADLVRDSNKLLIIMKVFHKDIAWKNDRDDSRNYCDDDDDDNDEKDEDESNIINPNDINEKCHCYVTYDIITGEEFICMEPELDKV